jgi:ATP-binding cassette subfamily C (CFTR/MRP) protein 1
MQYVETQSYFTSVERALELTKVAQEAPTELSNDPPVAEWPSSGQVSFSNVVMAYRENLDPVLCDVSFTIPANAKIGIVGRTGAGKSSLAYALFRIVELGGGTISIDNRDIRSLGLATLRRRMTMIPQDPSLFAGTIQSNLDPFGEFTKTDIESAANAVRLIELVGKLDQPVNEMGTNLSTGQKQLLCLGRAILNRSHILVMDEATANVDFETDQLIQRAIREQFQHSTVITVAHRLHTIIDYDFVLVMHQGKAFEFASPRDLLSRSDSMFSSLVEKSGDGAKLRSRLGIFC